MPQAKKHAKKTKRPLGGYPWERFVASANHIGRGGFYYFDKTRQQSVGFNPILRMFLAIGPATNELS